MTNPRLTLVTPTTVIGTVGDRPNPPRRNDRSRKGGLDLDQLDIELPQLSRVAAGQIGAQKISA
jgi:hypothetical protein